MHISAINHHSLQGIRPTNEDKHRIIMNEDGKDQTLSKVNFFSIYDGHGGKSISEYLYNFLHKKILSINIHQPLFKNAVYDIYDEIQKNIETSLKKNAYACGSTSLVLIQYKHENNNMIYVINTGDSRAVLCRNNMAYVLTKDHKPGWPEEKYRIEKLGGKIIKDDFGEARIKDLSVSRAFGDIKAHPYVTHIPDTFRYKLGKKDKFIILACDGLYECVSDQDAVNFVLNSCYNIETGKRINININIAQKLAEYALFKKSGDNITIIIIFFEN